MQGSGTDGAVFVEQTRGTGCVRAVDLEGGCVTLGSFAHDPCDRAMLVNDEVRHSAKTENAAVPPAPDSWDAEYQVSTGDVENCDARAPGVDVSNGVRVGDDRSGKRDLANQLNWGNSARFDERDSRATT